MKQFTKITILILLVVSLTHFSKAQSPYVKGALDLNLGSGVTSRLGFIPVYFGANYMILDFISIGAELSLRLDRQSYYYGYYGGNQNFKRTGFGIVTRGDYHFNELLGTPDKYDIFAGIDLGVAFYGKSTYEDYVYSNSDVYFIAGPHVGAKWFFSEKLGLILIVGGRSSDGFFTEFGLTWRLK